MTNKPYATMVSDMPPPIATEYYNKVGDAEFRKSPIAAGAWKFVSQALNSDVKYERFDDYWDASRKPNFKNLTFQIVPDESSRVAGVKTGDLDIAYGLTAVAATQFEGDDAFKIVETKGTASSTSWRIDNVFPDEESPLKNLNVRKALTMAIDREGIAKSLYGATPRSANSPIPSVMLGFDPDVKALPYDPDEAKELLAKSGNADLSLTLNSYNATSSIPDVAEAGRDGGVAVEGGRHQRSRSTSPTPARSCRRGGPSSCTGAGMIVGPVYFYYEPARLALSFFSTIAAYTTVIGDPELDALVRRRSTGDRQGQADRARRASSTTLLTDKLWGNGLVVVVVAGRSPARTWPAATTMKGCPYAGRSTGCKAK